MNYQILKQAKKLYSELCEQFGSSAMFIYTGGHKHLAIYDYIKDQSINDYIKSLFN